jgi:hypothetical protein
MKTLSCAVILACYVVPAYAQEVVRGCTSPPTTFGKTWYIDPVNGKTALAGGNGSQAHPWNSLQAVFAAGTGYTYPLLTTASYKHVEVTNAATGAWAYVFGPGPGSGPIAPGDEILLMSGNYGVINVGYSGVEISNPYFVTIAAAPGQTPVLSSLTIWSTTKMQFNGIKVQGLASVSALPLIQIRDQGGSLQTSDLVFENMTLSSQDDVSGWTQAQWIANARTGFNAQSSAGGAYTKCVSMTGSHITNVRTGAGLTANNSIFSGNEIDHFGDDGIDFAASDLYITKNYIHDAINIGDSNHPDAMQGQIGAALPGVVNNYQYILIDSNRIIRQTDPHLQWPNFLQGIDAFDADWTYVTVTNNVVVTSACSGINFSSLHAGKIMNNTVVADGLLPTAGCVPIVSIGDKTHEGTSSSGSVLRNNLASGVNVYNLDPGVTADHNVGISSGSGVVFVYYVNGVGRFFGTPGGTYASGVIASGGPVAEFGPTNWNPSTLTFNVELQAGAQAIGAGTATGAPGVDIMGVARNPQQPDAGAYSYPQ